MSNTRPRGRPRSAEVGVPVLVRLPEPEATWLRQLADRDSVGLATAGRTVMVHALRTMRAAPRPAPAPIA